MVQARVTTEQHMAALAEVLRLLREQPSPELLMQITIEYLSQTGGYPLIWVALYEPVSKQLSGVGGKLPQTDLAMLRQKITLAAGDRFDQVVIQNRAIGISDLRQENHVGHWQKVAQQAQVQGSLIHPITAGQKCLGVVLLGNHLWGQFHPEELSRLSIVFSALGAALEQDQRAPVVATALPSSPAPPNNLTHLLQQITDKPTVHERLQVAVQEVQKAVDPSRTSLYWWEPALQAFTRRLQVYPAHAAKTNGHKNGGGLGGGLGSDLGSKLFLAEIPGFYKGLSRGQLVGISDIQSSITNLVPQRLMQQLHLQALLAAPILSQGELLGFISVEMTNPRLWQDADKQYLQSVAQILSLVVPLETLEVVIEQGQQEQALLASLTPAIMSEQIWKTTLRQAAERLCQNLYAERLLLLQLDPETQGFQISYQYQVGKLRPLAESLRPLTPLDLQALGQQGVISIDSFQEELRLAPWQETLQQMGIRSLLLCNMTPNAPLRSLLLVTQESPRHWSPQESRFAAVVGQQLGLLTHQWQLQLQTDEQHIVYQTVQRGLDSIAQTQSLSQVELAALNQIALSLPVPLAALVTWQPGHQQGWVVVPEGIKPKFSVQTDALINIETDPLVQAALQRLQEESDPVDPLAGMVFFERADLAEQTRHWLCGAEIGQVIAIALQTHPDCPATGVLVFADRFDRVWSPLQLDVSRMLARHFAWAHRSLALTQLLQDQSQNLECLNWYKHRRLEDIYRSLANVNQQLLSLSQLLVPSIESQFAPVLKQMHSTLATVPALLKKESWRLKFNSESVMLVSLIKRSINRLESVIKQNHLRIQVHSNESISLTGDIAKIDLLIYELLLAACHRLSPEGRIDIWCQPLESEWVEISITDNGAVDAQLLMDLHYRAQRDLLVPSSLDRLPGRHLKVCQILAEKLKGEADIYKLEDGRTLSRLVLPLQN
jgi:putative methionine-R-sulfoxide reductase with GAF domain